MDDLKIEIIEDFVDVSLFDHSKYNTSNYVEINDKRALWLDDFNHNQSFIDTLTKKLKAAADNYADTHYNSIIESYSRLGLTLYEVGGCDEEHSDELCYDSICEKRGQKVKITDTVSACLIIEKALKGGELTFRDSNKEKPMILINPDVGTLVLFPGDLWHQVLLIEEGTRRSIVSWWFDV